MCDGIVPYNLLYLNITSIPQAHSRAGRLAGWLVLSRKADSELQLHGPPPERLVCVYGLALHGTSGNPWSASENGVHLICPPKIYSKRQRIAWVSRASVTSSRSRLPLFSRPATGSVLAIRPDHAVHIVPQTKSCVFPSRAKWQWHARAAPVSQPASQPRRKI